MTKSKRAAELVRLAWLADSGLLCVGSPNPDVAEILDAIGPELVAHQFGGATFPPYAERLRVACDLFASAAMSWAVAMGGGS